MDLLTRFRGLFTVNPIPAADIPNTGAVGTIPNVQPNSYLCEHCGRDRRSAIHDGFNGLFIDEAMNCNYC